MQHPCAKIDRAIVIERACRVQRYTNLDAFLSAAKEQLDARACPRALEPNCRIIQHRDVPMPRKKVHSTLVIDIGGGHVKFRVSHRRAIEQFTSGPVMTARQAVKQVLKRTRDWRYDRVTIGFPGIVIDACIVCEPANLGHGWVGFDSAKAFGCPVRIMNDAAMQALGGYTGGRMLFLGFGTALGSVLIADSTIYPIELSHLPFTKRGLIQNNVGDEARRRLGNKRWSTSAKRIISELRGALHAQVVMVGGGNALNNCC